MPISLLPIHSRQSDGSQTRLLSFATTTGQHYNHSPWVLEDVLGRGEHLHAQILKIQATSANTGLAYSLAYFEMRSILVRVLWNFDMQMEEESKGWMEQKEYFLWDKPSLWVKLKHHGLVIG